QTSHGGLPPAGSAADAPRQPADDHAEGVLSAGAGGGRIDDRVGTGVPAGLSDPGGGDRPPETPVAAAGPPPSPAPDPHSHPHHPRRPVRARGGRPQTRLRGTRVPERARVVAAVGEYREAIEDFFASWPTAQWVRTLPIGDHGITAPSLWARLGDAPERWESFRHLQAQAGAVAVPERSGQPPGGDLRLSCDPPLRLRHGVAVRGRSRRFPLAPFV